MEAVHTVVHRAGSTLDQAPGNIFDTLQLFRPLSLALDAHGSIILCTMDEE